MGGYDFNDLLKSDNDDDDDDDDDRTASKISRNSC